MTRTALFSTSAAAIAIFTVAAGAEPARYASPFDAVEAVGSALRSGSRDEILTIFGPESEDLVYSGNRAEDLANRLRLLDLYRQGFRLVPEDEGSYTLSLGAEDWPFPIPIARAGDGWSFDMEAGAAELAAREIGANELDVIDLLDAYVDVQAEFRLADRDGDGVMEFARYIISSAEDRDGLFWADAESPLGVRIAQASLDGYADADGDQPPIPLSGYYFRLLDGQGPSAPGGAMSYVVNGNMVAGHAMLAVPAIPGETGVMSFLVSENGQILQADLGADTLAIAEGITVYDPDATWTPVDD
ncbi:DUF2950 family protein [Palleronia sp. KMU-117]|uniref:DUF2950 family protein n=1 Tax=Palleronia sp. KMU-117 TaxID=3434108 RepID=UPI003D76530C